MTFPFIRPRRVRVTTQHYSFHGSLQLVVGMWGCAVLDLLARLWFHKTSVWLLVFSDVTVVHWSWYKRCSQYRTVLINKTTNYGEYLRSRVFWRAFQHTFYVITVHRRTCSYIYLFMLSLSVRLSLLFFFFYYFSRFVVQSVCMADYKYILWLRLNSTSKV
jgi:hypothetical protein